jgi:RNA polymerase sigma factor (sigma-70 family)
MQVVTVRPMTATLTRSIPLSRPASRPFSEPTSSASNRETQRWAEALRRGDERALSKAYDLYHGVVFAAVRRIVLDRVAAEDITQEVFVYLWRNPDRIDPSRGTPGPFLITVARRRAIDYLRSEECRRRREQFVASSSFVGGDRSAEPDVADAIIATELRSQNSNALRQAIRLLPEPERVLIDLVYFQGHTLRGVAVATNSPEGTAKTRVRRALRRLEETMAPQFAC